MHVKDGKCCEEIALYFVHVMQFFKSSHNDTEAYADYQKNL